MSSNRITSPDDPKLIELCGLLAERAVEMDRHGVWPAEQLRLCGEYGVYEWFIDPAWGGQGWNEEQLVRGYLALSAACLTTTFILTQRTGACRRIEGCANEQLKQRLLPGLVNGDLFATVGISHLTTSRRHLGKPVLTAELMGGMPTPSGGHGTCAFRLNGMSPWVTGGRAADVMTIAAVLVEGDTVTDRELLMAVPKDTPGLSVADPLPLVGVTASSTGPIYFNDAEVSHEWLIAGPLPNVMSSGLGGATGSYETSTLAVGLAQAAIDFLAAEAAKRPDLTEPMAALRAEHATLLADLLAIARGNASCTKESIRQRANSLVLRATQAALSAAKGSGYVVGHPAGRWCREAMFFLVWSCPQPVSAANLCELAGIAN